MVWTTPKLGNEGLCLRTPSLGRGFGAANLAGRGFWGKFREFWGKCGEVVQ